MERADEPTHQLIERRVDWYDRQSIYVKGPARVPPERPVHWQR